MRGTRTAPLRDRVVPRPVLCLACILILLCVNVCVWRAHAYASVLTLSIISIIDTGWHFGDHGSAEQSTASSVGPPLKNKNTFGSVRGYVRGERGMEGVREKEAFVCGRARDSACVREK